jgi:predicted amidophosphoribosyltransferase
VARVALVAYKDGDRRDLRAVLAPMLAGAMMMALVVDPLLAAVRMSGRPVLVVPVPSSPAAVRRRGDAPLEVLTRAAAGRCARPEGELTVSPVLRLRRRVADQAGLNHGQRAANLERAMQVRPRWEATVRGATCLLTDDVLTTGATLVEAARALRAGGADHVAAAAVAATRRHGVPVG